MSGIAVFCFSLLCLLAFAQTIGAQCTGNCTTEENIQQKCHISRRAQLSTLIQLLSAGHPPNCTTLADISYAYQTIVFFGDQKIYGRAYNDTIFVNCDKNHDGLFCASEIQDNDQTCVSKCGTLSPVTTMTWYMSNHSDWRQTGVDWNNWILPV